MSETKINFSAAAVEQTRAAMRLKPTQHMGRRDDLRGKTLFTCVDRDGDSSDCAFSVENTEAGVRLGVHISDVCEYVCEGSPLYKEARVRGASYDDLFPQELTDDICNLKVGHDRLAVSIYFDLTEGAELKSVHFGESIIRTAACCVYREMDDYILAGDSSAVMGLRAKYGPILNSFTLLYETAAKLYAKRMGIGGAEINECEYRCTFDKSGKMISSIRLAVPDFKAMMRELVIFADSAVGKYMYERKIPTLYYGLELQKPAHGVSANTALGYFATESEHFTVKFISEPLPAAAFSAFPIRNDVCSDDTVIRFTHPLKKYADLVTLQLLKNAIFAGFDANDMNINKLMRETAEKAKEATEAELEASSRLEAIVAEAKCVLIV